MSPPQCPVRVWSSAAELPADEWDALTRDATVYSSSGWIGVRAEELPADARARYTLADAPDGRALAAGESYAFTSPPHRLYAPSALLDGLLPAERLAELDAGPFVLGSGWSEFRGQIPLSPTASPEEHAAAVVALAEAAAEFAHEVSAGLLAYTFLPLDQALRVAHAHRDRAPVLLLQDVESVLPTAWPDFEDYLAWLPRSSRKQARRERRRFQESGRTLTEGPLQGDTVEVTARLNHQLMQKYGHTWFDTERARSTFDRQSRHLAGRSSVLLDEDGGDPVAFALRYTWDGRLYARVVGVDYGAQNHADYFTLVFYRPVLDGPATGIDEVHLGLGTYVAKLSRGARPVPLYGVFVGVDRPLEVGSGTLREHNVSFACSFDDDYGRYAVEPLDVEAWPPPDPRR